MNGRKAEQPAGGIRLYLARQPAIRGGQLRVDRPGQCLLNGEPLVSGLWYAAGR
jgi:hypothetical protein